MELEIQEPQKLAPPSDVYAIVEQEIHLNWWSQDTPAEGYCVYRGEDARSLTKIAAVFGKYRREFIDTATWPGTRYYYAVSAIGSGIESPLSKVIEVVA